jgi:hypothetical protein
VAVTPKNFPKIKVGLEIGFESTVVMVFDSISSVTAAVAEKMAMNKPERNSVDRPNSRRSFISSSMVYIDIDGAMMNEKSAQVMMTA